MRRQIGTLDDRDIQTIVSHRKERANIALSTGGNPRGADSNPAIPYGY